MFVALSRICHFFVDWANWKRTARAEQQETVQNWTGNNLIILSSWWYHALSTSCEPARPLLQTKYVSKCYCVLLSIQCNCAVLILLKIHLLMMTIGFKLLSSSPLNTPYTYAVLSCSRWDRFKDVAVNSEWNRTGIIFRNSYWKCLEVLSFCC